jgi:Signal transduction histidine kinase
MTLAATFVVMLAMMLSSWFIVRAVRSSLRENLRTASTVALADARERLAEPGREDNRLPVPSRAGFVILVVERSGTIVGGSPGFDSGRWIDFVGTSAANHGVVSANGRPFPGAIPLEHHVWFVGDRIFNFIPVNIGTGNGTTPGFLVAAGTLGALEGSIHTLTTTLWWTVPGLIIFVALVAWGVTGRALRPVETIRSEVTAITHSSLDQRVSEPRANDEVGRLARTMNQMLDRLQDASERQRQFVSDASHELRSPVAAIRATGEVALAHPSGADWPTVVRTMLSEDERMEQIVHNLLDLARDEAAELPQTPIDLDDVVLEEAVRARRNGRDVQSERVSAGRVRGSREQLTRVVRNLLDNAVRHADHSVRVSLASADDVTLVVEDDGPGIPTVDREQVFERFTRLDEGRARDAGGLGLGLAMVRSITEHHGGTVEITDAVDSEYPGARLVVHLPRSE